MKRATSIAFAGVTLLACVSALAIVADQPKGAGDGLVIAPAAMTSSMASSDVTASAAGAEPPAAAYRRIGRVTPRSAAQMKTAGITSPFSIGTETTDRNFSIYRNWAAYLGPLGFPSARVQTGWANVEQVAGTYDYSRLDEIVDGELSQGVQPWLNLQYGNPVYSGGGSTGIGSRIPSAGSQGYTAWLAFVRTTVARYNGRVTEWEIWNEPDGQNNYGPAAFASFAVDTAKAIKEVQPNAKIILAGFTNKALSGDSFSITTVNNFADGIAGIISPADVQVTYHPYTTNPDNSYGSGFTDFRQLVEGRGFSVRQGENGAPSENQEDFALSGRPWTEESQAKWNLRRLLNDFYRGIPTSIFTLTDLHTSTAKNTKGLLTTGTWSSQGPTYGDQTVTGTKISYRALQAATSIFDSRLQPVTTPNCTQLDGSPISSFYRIHAYTRLDPNNIRRNMLVVWRSRSEPFATGITPTDISFRCTAFNFPRFASNSSLRPRYADLLTQDVYELVSNSVVVNQGAGVTVTGLRVYDSPVVLADQGIVQFTP